MITAKLMILKKEQKKIKQGKQWLIKISKKFLSWETVLSNIFEAGKLKNSTTNRKFTGDYFLAPKLVA